MGRHFDNQALAETHLEHHDFDRLSNGRWRKREGRHTLWARIVEIPNTEIVLLEMWED
jgi:hypothetical protein